jgi:hypothetical protein
MRNAALNRTWKFDQEPVAGCLHKATAAPADSGIENSLSDFDQPRERSLFIYVHQARVAHHVRSEDRGEAAGGHSGIPAARYI